MSNDPEEPMTTRQALALGIMALEHVAENDGADVLTWRLAAARLREALHYTQPEPGRWDWYSKPRNRKRGRR
jgi:hypothetical protein